VPAKRQIMNRKQTVILIVVIAIAALILWNGLPIEFPWAINLLKLCLKLAVLIALFTIAFIFAGGKKKPS
jgi:hypothetical protein